MLKSWAIYFLELTMKFKMKALDATLYKVDLKFRNIGQGSPDHVNTTRKI